MTFTCAYGYKMCHNTLILSDSDGSRSVQFRDVWFSYFRMEGRTWYTSHRGRLWIAAAAKTPTPQETAEVESMYRQLYKRGTLAHAHYRRSSSSVFLLLASSFLSGQRIWVSMLLGPFPQRLCCLKVLTTLCLSTLQSQGFPKTTLLAACWAVSTSLTAWPRIS